MNPLGAKGIGESGTIGSTPAVQSAVVDASPTSASATSTCPPPRAGVGGHRRRPALTAPRSHAAAQP